jgi:hypothetical protein
MARVRSSARSVRARGEFGNSSVVLISATTVPVLASSNAALAMGKAISNPENWGYVKALVGEASKSLTFPEKCARHRHRSNLQAHQGRARLYAKRLAPGNRLPRSRRFGHLRKLIPTRSNTHLAMNNDDIMMLNRWPKGSLGRLPGHLEMLAEPTLDLIRVAGWCSGYEQVSNYDTQNKECRSEVERHKAQLNDALVLLGCRNPDRLGVTAEDYIVNSTWRFYSELESDPARSILVQWHKEYRDSRIAPSRVCWRVEKQIDELTPKLSPAGRAVWARYYYFNGLLYLIYFGLSMEYRGTFSKSFGQERDKLESAKRSFLAAQKLLSSNSSTIRRAIAKCEEIQQACRSTEEIRHQTLLSYRKSHGECAECGQRLPFFSRLFGSARCGSCE